MFNQHCIGFLRAELQDCLYCSHLSIANLDRVPRIIIIFAMCHCRSCATTHLAAFLLWRRCVVEVLDVDVVIVLMSETLGDEVMTH